MLKEFVKNRLGAGFMSAIILLIGVMMAIAIGAIVFFAFINNITGTSSEANDTIAKLITYAVIVFGLLVIIPLIMVGGLMLRSLGYFGGGGV